MMSIVNNVPQVLPCGQGAKLGKPNSGLCILGMLHSSHKHRGLYHEHRFHCTNTIPPPEWNSYHILPAFKRVASLQPETSPSIYSASFFGLIPLDQQGFWSLMLLIVMKLAVVCDVKYSIARAHWRPRDSRGPEGWRHSESRLLHCTIVSIICRKRR